MGPAVRSSMSAARTKRRLYRRGPILIALPLLVVVCTGILLQLKRASNWVQPPDPQGSGGPPTVAFEAILAAAATVPEASVRAWDDVDRLDVRPLKGVVKVRAKSGWEVQVDTATGEVLQAAVRRSDVVESIHDGSFFHEQAKLWVFLPAAAILAGLWGTGDLPLRAADPPATSRTRAQGCTRRGPVAVRFLGASRRARPGRRSSRRRRRGPRSPSPRTG
jgi:hypothetical protein